MRNESVKKLVEIGSRFSVFLNRNIRLWNTDSATKLRRAESVNEDRRHFSIHFLIASVPLWQFMRTNPARLDLTSIATPQNAEDEIRINAERAFGDAESLIEKDIQGASHQAIEKYKQALAGWRELGDRREEAITLINAGKAHYYMSEDQPAYDYFNEALRIWQMLDDFEGMAESYFYIACVHVDWGNLSLARDGYLRSYDLWQSLNNLQGQARCKITLAVINVQLGDKQQAFNLYREALDINRQLGDRYGETAALNGLGYAYLEEGEMRNAIDYADKALKNVEDLGTKRALIPQILAHATLGQAYTRLGEHQTALLHITKELEFSQRIEDRRLQGYSFEHFGSLSEALGEKQKALDYYERALALHREVQNRPQESATLNSIGYIHELDGDGRRALESYRTALQISRETENLAEETRSLDNIARVSRDPGSISGVRKAYDIRQH